MGVHLPLHLFILFLRTFATEFGLESITLIDLSAKCSSNVSSGVNTEFRIVVPTQFSVDRKFRLI